jgi:hypothetical protein
MNSLESTLLPFENYLLYLTYECAYLYFINKMYLFLLHFLTCIICSKMSHKVKYKARSEIDCFMTHKLRNGGNMSETRDVKKPGIVAHICNPSSQESEAGGFQVLGHPGPRSHSGLALNHNPLDLCLLIS